MTTWQCGSTAEPGLQPARPSRKAVGDEATGRRWEGRQVGEAAGVARGEDGAASHRDPRTDAQALGEAAVSSEGTADERPAGRGVEGEERTEVVDRVDHPVGDGEGLVRKTSTPLVATQPTAPVSCWSWRTRLGVAPA